MSTLVKPCLLITLINCLKAFESKVTSILDRSFRVFSKCLCLFFNNGHSLTHSLSDKVTYRAQAVLGTAKKIWNILWEVCRLKNCNDAVKIFLFVLSRKFLKSFFSSHPSTQCGWTWAVRRPCWNCPKSTSWCSHHRHDWQKCPRQRCRPCICSHKGRSP